MTLPTISHKDTSFHNVPWSPVNAIGLILLYLPGLILVAIGVLHLFRMLLPDSSLWDVSGVQYFFAYGFTFIIMAFILVQWKKKKNISWAMLGVRSFDKKRAIKYLLGYPLYFIAVAILLTAIAAIIINIFGIELPPPKGDNTMQSPHPLGLFITMVILTPFIEEVLFRGVLFAALIKRWGVWPAIAISSVVFSIFHLNPIQIIITLIAGVYLGVMYYRLKSIIPGILLHMANNLLAYLLIINQ
jgi:membrane protease YdiL (CAAX protease family)